MRNRIDILMDLVGCKSDLLVLKHELSQYDWDTEAPVMIISKQEFYEVLRRCIDNDISIEELDMWANIIECRDDVDFETENMQEIVFEIANQEINGEITKDRLQEIVYGFQ